MTGEGKRLESEEDLTYTMQLQAAQTRGPRSPARTPASRGTNMSRGTNKLSALKEATGSQHRSTLKTTLGKTSTVGSRTMSRQEEQHQMLNRRRIEQHEAKQREVVEESKLRVEAMHQKREKRFNFLYDTVFQGMMDPSGILTEMDAKLATHERAKEKRKEHVYDHMQHNLQSQLSQRSIEDIEARHNRNLEAYLRTQQFKGNQHYRGGVFRDVIIESDYDPLVANQSAIKIDVTGMKDPLKKDLERVRREKEELGYEVVNHGPVPGKTLFPVTMYHQPEATPYGHFSEPDGSLKEPLQQYKDTSAKKNASKVNMDQYSVARGKEVMLKEQLGGDAQRAAAGPRGGAPIGHRVGRRDFAEVVSHTHHLAPKHARADDQWLNAKGKMPVAAPCDPNRAGGLYDVINDLSDHRAPGGHGDLWMSQKGKLGGINPNPPPGTRRDLFEVVHQSEGRIFPGFTSGDRWIEAKGKKPFQNSSNYERRPPGEANIDYCLQDNDGIPLMP
eukprot:CAMPEP_0114326436 /NCGR_PEP_ID=MMETSP0059-20121206/29724_1 /TAXON_ID=36894 /ORGANISM="Pyramimonas parkeae, Strain CCMP726" /LENGTH=501 /DNA_ID=CAMNT_0001455411 /DNA_START=157 /DNA_END=1663 /DNA_ORIENTATION=-